MLVEINLLPKKNPKSRSNIIILTTFVLVIVIVSLLLYIQIKGKQEELLNIENELSLTTEIITSQQQKIYNYQQSNSLQELQAAITWAEEQPINTVYLLKQLTRILPERGFVTVFELKNKQKVVQLVQFDTKSEAAFYLNSLLSYEWVDEAVMNEGKSTDILEGHVDQAIEDLQEGNVEPRYFAQFEVHINLEKLAAATKIEEAKEGEDSP